MRKLYSRILKKHFHEALIYTRDQKEITQLEMSKILCMDERSYIDLDHGKTCCSAITLALFLLYICEDVGKFLEELRHAIEAVSDKVA